MFTLLPSYGFLFLFVTPADLYSDVLHCFHCAALCSSSPVHGSACGCVYATMSEYVYVSVCDCLCLCMRILCLFFLLLVGGPAHMSGAELRHPRDEVHSGADAACL